MKLATWPTSLENPTVEPFITDFPQNVGIEITGRCQLRCRHCFNDSGPDRRDELPLEIIERLLDEMVAWNVDRLRISGGEPTVHHQFREVIAACHDRGIGIAMNTNGIYTREMLAYLKTAPIELFFISVDGLEEHNDAIRGSGTFGKAIQACRELHRAGKKVMISFHVGAENRGDVQPLIALAAEMGVDIKISPIRPIGRASVEMPGALIDPRDYLEVVSAVTRLRGQYPHIEIRTDFDILDGPPISACEPDPSMSSCKAGRTMVNISYDGSVLPCAFFATGDNAFSAGNINTDSISQLWRHSPVFEPFRVQQKSEKCQGCGQYQTRCYGGCPAIAHFATGHLDAHDPTCFVDLVQLSIGDAT